QMAFGDVLAVGLMQLKNFDHEQYKLNHPAGRIGKQMLLKVEDLMLKGNKIPLCKADEKLVDILVELSTKQCGCLLVINDNKILNSILTHGDLRRRMQQFRREAVDKQEKEETTANPPEPYPDGLAPKALELMKSDQKPPITVSAVVEKDTGKVN